MTFRWTSLAPPLFVVAGSLHAAEICRYTARISSQDKLTQSGKPLMAAANMNGVLASLQMDRANFHRFQKRDAEDTSDCLFADTTARQKMMALGTHTELAPGLLNKIWKEEPVLTVQVYKKRLVITEAEAVSASAPTASLTAVSTRNPTEARDPSTMSPLAQGPAPAVVPTPTAGHRLSLIEHPETVRAAQVLGQDRHLQRAFQQSFGVAEYAECAAMVADIEEGMSAGQYSLTARQITAYAGVAAGMSHVRQSLKNLGTDSSVMEQALRAVQQRPAEQSTYFEQCYKAMMPVYETARQTP